MMLVVIIPQLALSGNAYNNFVDTIKSDQTREQYKRCLARFMRYCSIKDIDNLLVLSQDSKTIQQKIIDYIVYLKRERNLGANAINLYVGSIFSLLLYERYHAKPQKNRALHTRKHSEK